LESWLLRKTALSLLPLVLGVGERPGTEAAVVKNRSRLKAEMEKALWRDGYTCRCCGFHSSKYQSVIPASPGSKEDFLTVCKFCESCLALEKTGLSGAGVLVWLPEIPQTELHHIMRAIYILRGTEHPLAAAAEKAYEGLLARRAEAKKRLGSDDPLLLATVLSETLTDAEYASRQAKLEGLRLLPLDRWIVRGRSGDINHFPQIIKYWRSSEGPFGKFPPETWGALLESVTAKAGKPH
jgi:hypothetical protein